MELTYRTTIAAARFVFRALGLRLEVDGDDRVPVDGPVLLAANHLSYLDFTLVGLAARRSRRNVRFLARHDTWRGPVGTAMTAMGHVPVDPAAPAAAYLAARRLLRRGEAVGIFPEAGISTSYAVRGLKPGTAALAAETGVPVLPVAIWGPQRIATVGRVDLRRGRPVSVRVGAPIHVGRREDVREATAGIGHVLQSMADGLAAEQGLLDSPAWPSRPPHPAGSASRPTPC